METTNLKRVFRIFILCSMIFLSINFLISGARAENGDRVGNGGSGNEAQLAAQQAELLQILQKIRVFFLKYPQKMTTVFPEFSTRHLVNTINSARIEVSNKSMIDKNGIKRTCLNYLGSSFIECNYELLQEIKKDPKSLFVLALHEILGLIGVEETSPKNASFIGGYKVSKRIAPYVTKVADYDLSITPQEKRAKKRVARNFYELNEINIAVKLTSPWDGEVKELSSHDAKLILNDIGGCRLKIEDKGSIACSFKIEQEVNRIERFASASLTVYKLRLDVKDVLNLISSDIKHDLPDSIKKKSYIFTLRPETYLTQTSFLWWGDEPQLQCPNCNYFGMNIMQDKYPYKLVYPTKEDKTIVFEITFPSIEEMNKL